MSATILESRNVPETLEADSLTLGRLRLSSRLIIGSGKYKTFQLMKECIFASGTSLVTVAIRRINLEDRSETSFKNFIPHNVSILPNTAGCYTAHEAIRTARLARELLETDLIKLEVIGDPMTLLPDTEQLLQATKTLVKEGFAVLPYTNDDPVMAKKLVDAGACAIMPLAAPIGSGQGVINPLNIHFIRSAVTSIPLIIDAGVGTSSDAAVAMELGADGILMNTAIAEANNPVLMAKAMKLATEAGRMAYLAGRMPKRETASASSPSLGKLGENK